MARELRRLEELRIVTAEAVGRSLRYRLDRSSASLEETGGLVAETIGIEAVLR